MGAHILIIDDDKEIADLVEVYLRNEDYVVHICSNANDALRYISQEKIDLALLDIMLPDMDGLVLCQKIRMKHTFPIIMLTAKAEDTDKISGLMIGADDYITKPFSPLEVVARVKAQLRRFTRYNEGRQANEDVIDFAGLILDKRSHECIFNEKPLPLTPIEFSILWVLSKNRGQVISPEKIFQEVWGEKYFSNSNNTVMVHIRHIREKMKSIKENANLIKTIYGVGYKIEKWI